jgi:nucleoside-diphosphate-sugar epimerase
VARVLITGASGFIGYHLSRLLVEQGDQVTSLVRPTSIVHRLEELNVARREGDLGDVDSLRRAIDGQEVVYHLAGLTRALRASDFRRVNEIGTQNLATACQSATSPPTLIHVSSLAAAGPAVNGEARYEAHTPAPVSRYGQSKLASEQVVRRYADRFPITIVRPPIVFGQADRDFLQIVRPIHRTGIHTIPGFRPKHFSLVHAEDLAMMLIAAADRGERLPPAGNPAPDAHGIYFVEAEQRLKYGEIGLLVASALEKKVLRLSVPHAAIWLVAGVGQTCLRPFGRTPALNVDKAREATAGSWICNCEKAHTQLDFATAKPLSERMRETIDWYAAHDWL